MDNKKVLIEWERANAEEAAVLSRLTGKKFKPGARILARDQGMNHADKNHWHQYGDKDLTQLRKRLFDPRTDKSATKSGRKEPSVTFRFQRWDDLMEAVFTIHFPDTGSPGQLRLKTFAARKE